jgi:hypothetical protein
VIEVQIIFLVQNPILPRALPIKASDSVGFTASLSVPEIHILHSSKVVFVVGMLDSWN